MDARPLRVLRLLLDEALARWYAGMEAAAAVADMWKKIAWVWDHKPPPSPYPPGRRSQSDEE